jgi:hypothetical protein
MEITGNKCIIKFFMLFLGVIVCYSMEITGNQYITKFF